MNGLAIDFLTILAAGFVAALICRRIGLSMLIGYLVVGALIGGGGLGLIHDQSHEIELLAEAGVVFLLFSIGLEFSPAELRRLWRQIMIGGGAQMTIVALPVIGILLLFGVSWQASVLLGFALAMSSTVLVFKALAEFGQTTSPVGRRMISILLFQDVAVLPLLLLVPVLAGTGEQAGMLDWAILIGKTLGALVGIIVLREMIKRYFVPGMVHLRSPELLALFALLLLAGVTFAFHELHMPVALGGFAAGLMLSGNRITGQIDALILPYREAFSAIFFVSLGLLFLPSLLVTEPLFIFGGLILVLGLKFAAATIAARLTGLPGRSSIAVGMGLVQVGEFAFVLTFTGVTAGLISVEDYQRLLVFALISLMITPRMIRIGLRFGQSGSISDALQEESAHEAVHAGVDSVVIGIGPVGRAVVQLLHRKGAEVCAVDMSPVNLHPLTAEGFHTVAGDAQSPQILEQAGADKARLVVICVPQDEVALRLVNAVRKHNRDATVVVRCRYVLRAEDLSKAGADAVISEEAEAAHAIQETLESLSYRPQRP